MSNTTFGACGKWGKVMRNQNILLFTDLCLVLIFTEQYSDVLF